jgi:hypothetical protein
MASTMTRLWMIAHRMCHHRLILSTQIDHYRHRHRHGHGHYTIVIITHRRVAEHGRIAALRGLRAECSRLRRHPLITRRIRDVGARHTGDCAAQHRHDSCGCCDTHARGHRCEQGLGGRGCVSIGQESSGRVRQPECGKIVNSHVVGAKR